MGVEAWCKYHDIRTALSYCCLEGHDRLYTAFRQNSLSEGVEFSSKCIDHRLLNFDEAQIGGYTSERQFFQLNRSSKHTAGNGPKNPV